MTTYYAAVRLQLRNLWPFELKPGTPVGYSCPGKRSHEFCLFPTLFRLRSPCGSDRQTGKTR